MTPVMAAQAPPGYGRNKSKQRAKRRAAKLWLAAVSANIIGLFAAVYVSSYLRAGVGDPDTLFIFYYGAMVLAGIVDALWLDELLFKGAFRRTVQGKTGRFVGKNEDVDEVAATMRGSTMSFPVLVLLCTVLTYGLFNLVNRGFDGWWQDVGQFAHVLHKPDAQAGEQREAIVELSMRNRPEVLMILEGELLDGEPAVEAWAAWAIGRHKHNPAMNSNRLPALVERVRNGAPEVRREALITLGRLQHQPMADELRELLSAELDSGEAVDPRLIWALGYMQDPASLELLDRALYHPDTSIQRLAAWAISQHRDSGKGREAADLLEQRLPAAPLATKCAIVHSLGVLADERSNLALIHAYDSVSPEDRQTICGPIAVRLAPDHERDREDLMLPSRRFGMKTIQSMAKMRATSPQIREQVEPWLEAVIASDQTAALVKESAQSLLTGIRQRRNDRPG